jgi:hypothetical protein
MHKVDAGRYRESFSYIAQNKNGRKWKYKFWSRPPDYIVTGPHAPRGALERCASWKSGNFPSFKICEARLHVRIYTVYSKVLSIADLNKNSYCRFGSLDCTCTLSPLTSPCSHSVMLRCSHWGRGIPPRGATCPSTLALEWPDGLETNAYTGMSHLCILSCRPMTLFCLLHKSKKLHQENWRILCCIFHFGSLSHFHNYLQEKEEVNEETTFIIIGLWFYNAA